jgi:hypothetical protein
MRQLDFLYPSSMPVPSDTCIFLQPWLELDWNGPPIVNSFQPQWHYLWDMVYNSLISELLNSSWYFVFIQHITFAASARAYPWRTPCASIRAHSRQQHTKCGHSDTVRLHWPRQWQQQQVAVDQSYVPDHSSRCDGHITAIKPFRVVREYE